MDNKPKLTNAEHIRQYTPDMEKLINAAFLRHNIPYQYQAEIRQEAYVQMLDRASRGKLPEKYTLATIVYQTVQWIWIRRGWDANYSYKRLPKYVNHWKHVNTQKAIQEIREPEQGLESLLKLCDRVLESLPRSKRKNSHTLSEDKELLRSILDTGVHQEHLGASRGVSRAAISKRSVDIRTIMRKSKAIQDHYEMYFRASLAERAARAYCEPERPD